MTACEKCWKDANERALLLERGLMLMGRDSKPLRQAADLLAAEGWRDISTAPKDGTIFDVWLGDTDKEDVEFYCTPGTRRSAGWSWREGRLRPVLGLALPVVTVRPTHWMPLPSPPGGTR